MATYNQLRYYCPKCGHVIYRGTLSFGPGIVECKHCGEKIATGLTSWENISFIGKIGIFIKEILTPTFLGMDSALIRSVANFFLYGFSFLVVFTLITSFHFNPEIIKNPETDPVMAAIINIALMSGFIWYPFFLVFRVLRIRRASLNFFKKGTVPKW
jgi:hypothetical protein